MEKETSKKMIQIKLVKSVIGSLPAQRKTVKALGLGRIGSIVVQEPTPSILGMVRVVSHLVKVEEI
ncbi:50S ribosomal protein L30 [Parasphaerochaeta coccoides]|uniref:Large ribosomal subunit protein uL30 n=1 Tax=Parasphaerochaeta coccoides (strain ATCC BAA-1237 / DSM 17374 / SPN1) TaxID=760011 RepID=F4GKL3_PARC1|nr:50S ribosomal protein L30 [Parasphaerochaeta coccoides]AEC02896.1 LSU ribosomal protein L30P [Parasphaerochaeta coccoides DSM 17374]